MLNIYLKPMRNTLAEEETSTVLKLRQFAMPETCENWLVLVNSCVYYARHTRETYQALAWFSGFQSSRDALKSTE